MLLSNDAIKEYIEIYRQDFGEELTLAEARAIVPRLLALYELLCRLMPGKLPTVSSAVVKAQSTS